MSHRARPRFRLRGFVPLGLVCLAACTTPGQDLDLRVQPAPTLSPRVQVGAEIGRLLSPDPATSKQAEKRLVALTGEDLVAFLAYADTLQGEQDLRLLNVLDEHHALPELGTRAEIDFLLWKAALPERFYTMKAHSRLIDLAQQDPQPLIERLRLGGENVDVLGVVLALTHTEAAVPALLERYRSTQVPGERAAAAEALGMIAGEERRPRPSGRPDDIESDAAAIEAWYLERVAEREASVSTPPPGEER
jgi:hypothetical protein